MPEEDARRVTWLTARLLAWEGGITGSPGNPGIGNTSDRQILMSKDAPGFS